MDELKGMMEILRYSIEQCRLTDENQCLMLIGKYIDKLRGVDANDEMTLIEHTKNILMEKVVPHIGTDK